MGIEPADLRRIGRSGARRTKQAKGSTGRRGRVIGNRPPAAGERLTDPDLTASIVASLLNYSGTSGHSGTPPRDRRLHLDPRDLRMRVRRENPGTFILFLLDTSDSMGALERMAVTKGAVLALLQRAYQGRHTVALVSFGEEGAKTVLGPTRSVSLAKKALASMRPGGGTPLAAGLEAARTLLKGAARRFPSMRRILVVISDGEANVSFGGSAGLGGAGNQSFREALASARSLRKMDLHPVLIDTKLPTVGRENEMKQLHRLLGGRYVNASAPGLEAILSAVESAG